MRWPRSVWIPVLVAAAVVFGWGIGRLPLTNWDEGIYAHVNLELFRSHDWSELTYYGQPFLEKPPLQFWLTMPLIGIFGPTELAMRLWSVAAGIATALLIAFWSWQLWRQRTLSWFVAGAFIFGRFALYHAFRTGDLDGLLTFWITLALYSYWRSSDRPRWWLGWGVATALAIMTKSFVGIVPIVVVGLDILLGWRWRQISWKHLALGLVSLVLVAAPWHIVETVRFGQAFWNDYLGLHVLERTSVALFGTTPWWWYVPTLRIQFFPFSLFLPLAVLLAGRRWWRERDATSRLLMIWTLVVLGIFTLIQTRREWYILPLYPAAVLLIGQLWREKWVNGLSRLAKGMWWVSLIGVFAFLLQELQHRGVLWNVTPYRFLPAALWQQWPGRLAVAVVSALIVWLVARWLRGRRQWSATQWAAGLTAALIMFLAMSWTVLYLRHLPRTLPLEQIARRLQSMSGASFTVVGVNLKGQPAGYFYLRRLDSNPFNEQPARTPPLHPIVLTTTAANNALVNQAGSVMMTASPFVLVDLR
ncbi:MAG: glycosyltransferase family 39 protein [Candidatus Kerfeldbacteria bacterium]|nr:glycosyltransferase family 39 protein [Candidatus Kerfeldbacteria bacterium]